MINDLNPYPAMKDSGVPWLGEVPEHWSIARSKRLFRQRKEFARPEDQQLSATQAYGVIPQAIYESRTGYKVVKISLHLEKRRHVEADDFVISMRSFEGGLERAWSPGAIRSSYVVLKPSNEVHPGFFQYLFKSAPYITALRGTADFIRDGQDLNFENFCDVALPLIPPQEQSAIVRFLNNADRKIRRYIRAKQKLIKLLEEQKQAIIHRAVTRGLDPDVRLKPSGVEWLGDVPEHWEARSFSRISVERADYRGATPEKTDSGVFLVTAKNVRKGWIDYEVSREYVAQKDYDRIMRRGMPKCNDLLLTMEAPLGHVALVDREDIALAQRIVRFRFDSSRIHPRFILVSTLSTYFQNQLICRGTGSTAIGMKASKLPQLLLLLPPLNEQKQILTWIDNECRPLDRVKARAEAEIALLHEYRTRLIADVVTGKLDVRQAAAGLPEEDTEDEFPAEEFDEELDAAEGEIDLDDNGDA